MKERRERILVTGGTGTIGCELTATLARAGRQVRVASRQPSRAGVSDQVESVRFDFADPSTFEPALDGVEQLFLLSPTGQVDSAAFTARFVEAALPRVRKVVLLTAQGVDASEQIPHRRLERRIERSGLPYGILRPTWYADNFHTFWRPYIVKRGVIPLPAADSRTAFVDSRDVGAAAAALLASSAHDGGIYTLTGPSALRYDEAAACLSAACGRPIRYENVSDLEFERDAIAEGMPPDYARMVLGLLAGVRAGVTAELTDHVFKLTGSPPRPLRDYAARHAAAWSDASPAARD